MTRTMQQSRRLFAADSVSPHPRLAPPNQMPVELHSLANGTAAAHATLADSTVSENIMTGIHFWGRTCCGTYNRHNEVVQVAFAYFKYELKFSGSTSSGGQQPQACGHLCERQEQAHGWTGLGGAPSFQKELPST
jgi:hypothetical protein